MCGIAGIVHGDRERPVDREALTRARDSLAHRGPDDRDLWLARGVGLAHRRLSIIDLSEAGRQPMSNEDGSVWTVFNGEIYNFQELREELVAGGHTFRSKTDAEVIVHLYEDEGEAFVERLHGMFALAVWDSRRRRLVLARDRVGKKPLKYARVGKDLLFASELKALLATGLVPSDIDLRAVHAFMTRGYVPGPLTGFEGIRKLPAGHILIWQDGETRIERYWRLSFRDKSTRTVEEWKQAVRSTVTAAVKRRLVSDVPLGAFLSGGIDSSIVVACMAESMDRPVDTFSIGFEHEAFNELPFANAVAERYATNHHEFVVRADAADLLEQLAKIYEEPYADSSALPSYLLARESRRHVKVALNGDGGDEGFAGYARYARLERWSARLRWLNPTGLTALTRARLNGGHEMPSPFVRQLDKIHHISDPDLGVRYGWMMRLFSPRERGALYGEALRPYLNDPVGGLSELTGLPEGGESSIDRMLFADTMSYLPDDLLVKMDLATMAHGLETRSPLLAHEVLELAASVPAELKYHSGNLKWLLKEAFRDRIPPELLNRRKKGFGIPLDDWFRGPLSPMADELLLSNDSCLGELLERDGVASLVDQHRSGRVDHGHRLWALVMLELWRRSNRG